MVEVHLGAVEVVAGREPGLEDHDRRCRLGQHHAVELDADVPGRAQRVDPDVGVAGVDEDLLVLFEPGVEGVPLETDRAAQTVDRRPRRRAGLRWAGGPAGPEAVEVGGPAVEVAGGAPRRRADQRPRPRSGCSTAGNRATPTRTRPGCCRAPCWPARTARMRRGTGSMWSTGTIICG